MKNTNELTDNFYNLGEHTITWNGSSHPSGLYFV